MYKNDSVENICRHVSSSWSFFSPLFITILPNSDKNRNGSEKKKTHPGQPYAHFSFSIQHSSKPLLQIVNRMNIFNINSTRWSPRYNDWRLILSSYKPTVKQNEAKHFNNAFTCAICPRSKWLQITRFFHSFFSLSLFHALEEKKN